MTGTEGKPYLKPTIPSSHYLKPVEILSGVFGLRGS